MYGITFELHAASAIAYSQIPGCIVNKFFRPILLVVLCAFAAHAQFKNFITVKKDKLMDGDAELRFISFDVPTLHYIEDYLPFGGTNQWRLPDEFEIRDALTAVKQMGGKVVRMYVFSVKKEGDTVEVFHVEAPGKFNEEAFKTFDKVLSIANELGVRLIVPFVDNWLWWGGPKEYAAFRGKARDAFWTDQQLIGDFEKTIEFVLNRKNTVTGIPYNEDKAILAWETGNEIVAPFSWTKTVAAYIKSIDKNHLVMEGTLAREISEEALNDPDLDILSTHYYHDARAAVNDIVKNREMSKGKKPYLVGEYGLVPTEDIRMITDTVINQGLSGAMIWSLRFRNRDGGFYSHYEYQNYEAYRWPGFSSGDFYDERNVLTLLREKAHQIDGTTAERLPVPAPPHLLDINDVAEISWEGSTGAGSYTVERKEESDTSWTVAAANVDESRYQYRPLFSDGSAEIGKKYSYRVKAKNETGESGYSNVVGPVEAVYKTIVDEMENFDKVFQKDGALKLLTLEDIRRAKEDRSRLAGNNGSYIIYTLEGKAASVLVDYFVADTTKKVEVLASKDLETFADLATRKEVFLYGQNDYGYFDAVTLAGTEFPDGTKYIKIMLEEGVQISRIEIRSR
ncbi:MAG TPA: cellulase family glycosylhydrolase [Bacteroidota bacterium]|nr:cellulase family glycosylhydrolase [Bacteroidota bacterium]